jgi:hypothetical protein
MADATVLLEAIQQKIDEVSSSTDTTTLHLLMRVAVVVGQGNTIRVYNDNTEFPDAYTTNQVVVYSKADKTLWYNYGKFDPSLSASKAWRISLSLD